MDASARGPAAVRMLVSWQTNRLAVLAARLTGRRLPLEARSDFAVLAALAEHGALSQADIGRVLGLDRNTVNGIVTRLEEARRITRDPDPTDRRRNVVAITDEGRTHLAVLQEHAAAVQAELLAGLSAAEQDQLAVLLDKALAAHPAQPA